MVEVEYSINDIVNVSLQFLSPFIKSQENFRIFIKVKTVLPRSCDKKVFSSSVAGLLKKYVLDNIILNSVWAVSGIKNYEEFINNLKKKKIGTIIIRTKKRCNKFVIEVEDDGCGVGKEDLNNIFNKGFSKRGSKGLGLFLAKRAVERLGGKIIVNSELGKFTNVRVVL